jgi:hypothetical protein
MFDPLTRKSLVAVGVLALGLHAAAAAGAEAHRHFPAIGAAMDAIVAAAQAGDTAALGAILGPDSEELYSSGDPVADRNALQQFVEAVKARTVIEYDGPDRVTFSVGDDEWPVPTPLVKDAQGWRFDGAAGKEEIVNRRIGRNELYAIEVMRDFVEAQADYAASDPARSGVRQYAQRMVSSKGQKDGLYWPTAGENEVASPLGELAAAAVKEGYADTDPSKLVPFHGYYYRMLQAQGKNAPGGAKSYVVDGKMTGGFAFVAWPADYGNAGIKSFVVNQQGIVFEKDLGPDTEKVAAGITEYDPDDSWDAVEDTDIEGPEVTSTP